MLFIAKSNMDDYIKTQKKIDEKIKKSAKDSGSKILKNLSRYSDKEVDEHCRILNRLFSETVDMYRDGDFKDMEELAEELAEAIKAI